MDGDFDKFVEKLLDIHHVPGMSIAIVHNSKIQCKVCKRCNHVTCGSIFTVIAQGYGFSQLPATPATPDTLYFAGSTTKAMTSAAAGKIVHSEDATFKNIKWTTPIATVLGEDFVLTDDYATSHMSIEDALSHRSGLPAHDVSYGWSSQSLLDCIRSLRHLPFSTDFRTGWLYNNILYGAVGAVIERLIGKDLSAVLEDWFWKPLGMTSTTLSLDKALAMQDDCGNTRLARGYYWTKDDFYVPDAYPDFTPVAAAGAAISSVRDFSLWVKALLEASAGSSDASSLLSGDLFQDLVTPRSIVPSLYASLWKDCNGVTTCALGWLVQNLGSRTLISHGGGLVGFGTCVYLLPEEGFGFISMGNTVGSSNIVGNKLFFELLKRLGLHDGQDSKSCNLTDPASSTDEKIGGTKSEDSTRPSISPALETAVKFAGSYTHPAYGTVDVSDADVSMLSSLQANTTPEDLGPELTHPATLHVKPTERTWPNHYALRQTSPLAFQMDVFFQRGSDDDSTNDVDSNVTSTRSLAYKNIKVLEYLYTGEAMFEEDETGLIRRLGMEMSPELTDSEAAKTDAKAGMIWFEKS
jgi:CubicO group peptidase (beta-lactamase class C family)